MKKGFTLVELIVVITIITILAAIGVSRYDEITERGKMDEAKTNLRIMYMAQQMYKLNNSTIGYVGCADLNDCNNKLGLEMTASYFDYWCPAWPSLSGVNERFACEAQRNSGRYKCIDNLSPPPPFAGCGMAIASYDYSWYDEPIPVGIIVKSPDCP